MSNNPSFTEALLNANLPLMKIRLDEEYTTAFDKYESLVNLRTQILSDETRRREVESSGILAVLEQQIKKQACELRIQQRAGESAIDYLTSVLGGGN